MQKSLATPPDWNGSVKTCSAGSSSLASQKATLAAVNSARALAGLSPVKLSPSLTRKAQKAALVFKANSTSSRIFLSHTITRDVKCYSADARVAAAHSNIAASVGYGSSPVAGSKAVLGYLDEPGAGNTAAGHRRWILSPSLKAIGAGSTDSTNALYVVSTPAKSYKNPSWVTWPTSGYFPNELEPEGRWSISGKEGAHYDFSHTKIVVRTATGKRLTVHNYKAESGYASDTLVFQVHGVKKAYSTTVTSYKVTVSGIKKNGHRMHTMSYTVRLFDPIGQALHR